VSQDTPNEEDDEGETGKRATTITIKGSVKAQLELERRWYEDKNKRTFYREELHETEEILRGSW
jgi:hypothetical protein